MKALPDNVLCLACVRYGHETTDPWQWSCPSCQGEARMEVRYAPEAIEALADLPPGPIEMWRYAAVLPIPSGARLPPIQVGGSPVSEAPRVAEWLGVARAVLKDDGRNPSASLKDRASAIGVVMAVAAGKSRIVCASTGNAASATACLAASMGLPATIFVPARAPASKIAQLRIFGADVLRVAADYDTTWDLCAAVAATQPWYNRNCAVNPYLVEGKKTVGLELAEQLGDSIPDWVAITVGDGCTVAGLARGLVEAFQAGLIPRLPRVLAVQAAGAAPLVRAAREGLAPIIPSADTLADSLCVGHPRNPDKALQWVARTGGAWIAVPDAAILEALVEVPRRSGIFSEPAAAAGAAGVRAAVAEGLIRPDESVAVVLTGNGLKDTATALSAVSGPVDVAPDLEAVLALFEARRGAGAR
jgi:threonine synthase